MKKVLIALFFVFFLAQPVLASEFNPNYIISDSEILDSDSMTLSEIQNFINSKEGALKNYLVTEKDGLPVDEIGKTTMTAAEVIYERATTNKVNPKFLLTLIQKEQSLLTDTNPTQRQYDWAAGYGCPDSGGCNDRWQGFWKQINSASLQFRSYMDEPNMYKYNAGETYIFTNPYGTISTEDITVTPYNRATAALYNYTPHVYNGNYNFWKLWNRFFSRLFPDGTLVQVEGEAGVWLIQNGEKRPFLSYGALTTRYNTKSIINVKKADLDGYPKGAPIKFAQYSLLQSPLGVIYLLVDDTKRRILNPEVFRQLGFNPEEVEHVSSVDLSYYQDGLPISETDAYPTGALLRDPETGGVYFVINNKKAPLIDPIFLTTKFKNQAVIKSSAAELEKFEKIEPVKLDDGYLLKSNLSLAVYVISNGKKRTITSGKIFESLGYKWENIMEVHPRVLALYDNDEPLTEESLLRE
ncbi:MAG: hypothetical protein Q8Q23_03610 [bacterium]|nr:hypothetical protein [bacterium]